MHPAFRNFGKICSLVSMTVAMGACAGTSLPDSLTGKKSDSHSNYSSGTDTGPFKPKSLEIVPANLRMMVGEKFPLQSEFTNYEGAKASATLGTSWTGSDPAIATIDASNNLIGNAPGKLDLAAIAAEFTATGKVEVLSCKILGKGPKLGTQVRVDGDSWPSQGKDAEPPVYDDYSFVFDGDFLIDGYQVFSNSDQDIKISWTIGSGAELLKRILVQIVDCDKKQIKTHDFVPAVSTTGSVVLSAKRGDRLNLFVYAQESITSRTYDLIFEKESAFKLTFLPK